MYNDNNPFVTIIACVALVVGIVAGGLYIADHVHCFDFFGLARGCVVNK